MREISDQFFRQQVMEGLRLFQAEQDHYTLPEKADLASWIQKDIQGPLDAWIQRQRRSHAGTRAAAAFSAAIDDVTGEILHYRLEDVHLNALERAWGGFMAECDGGSLAFAENQRDKAKKPRGESRMKETVARLARLNPDMTARELWPLLKNAIEDRMGYTVTEETPNQKQPGTWQYFYDDKCLKFKTFQNILTKVKKINPD